MNTKNLVVKALLATAVNAADDYNYVQNGADWDLDYPGCGDSN